MFIINQKILLAFVIETSRLNIVLSCIVKEGGGQLLQQQQLLQLSFEYCVSSVNSVLSWVFEYCFFRTIMLDIFKPNLCVKMNTKYSKLSLYIYIYIYIYIYNLVRVCVGVLPRGWHTIWPIVIKFGIDTSRRHDWQILITEFVCF